MTDGNYDNPQIGAVMSEQEQLFDLLRACTDFVSEL